MRALVRLFKKRWLISLLGLLLLALLIWYAGPEFSFANWYPWASEGSRVFTILLIFGGWGLYRLVQFMRARAVSANVMAAILGRMAEAKDRQTPPSAGQEEVAVLERRIKEAVAVLKKKPIPVPAALVHSDRSPWLGEDHRAHHIEPAVSRHRRQGARARATRGPRHSRLRLVLHRPGGIVGYRRSLPDPGQPGRSG